MRFLGDVTGYGNPYGDGGVEQLDGRIAYTAIAVATLTSTLQTVIPLYQMALDLPLTLQGRYPPIPLQIPVGAQINRVDFKLPGSALPGYEPQPLVQLPAGCTIIGTTGEHLKVSPTSGTTFTTTSPVIIAASSAYAPDGFAIASRPAGVADAASPSLLTTVSGSPLGLNLAVSNSVDAAAGTGIALSLAGATAYVLARVCYTLPGNPIRFSQIDFPPAPDVTTKVLY